MGFATHLGPWLLGTIKNTTGTTAATTSNTGCTVVSQSVNVAYGTLTGNAIAIPAGSQIVDVKVVTTTVFSAATTCKDRKSTRLNSSHIPLSRMPSSA